MSLGHPKRIVPMVLHLLGCAGSEHTAPDANVAAAADAAVDAGQPVNAPPDAAHAAEDATTAGEQPSCYAGCGTRDLSKGDVRCSCDLGCHARGDCCSDKHLWCAAEPSAPVCTLTGKSVNPAVCGTDLGFSFEHQGKLEILFGDSYNVLCGTPLSHDDAQGLLPLARPVSIPGVPPAQPIDCGSLIEIDSMLALNGQATFAPLKLYQGNTSLSLWLGETPLTGFSDGSDAYALFRRGEAGSPTYLAYRDPSAEPNAPAPRAVYRVGTELPGAKFQNPTSVTVARFDRVDPGRSDFGPGHGDLFVWGRGAFWGDASESMFLVHHALPLRDANGVFQWSPRYFAGLDGNVPIWSTNEADALPVIERDFDQVNQLEVAWVPALEKWLMFYGGDVPDWIHHSENRQPRHGAIHMRMADFPWGPWSEPTPVIWREHVAAFLQCDAPPDPPPDLTAGCEVDEFPGDDTQSYSTGSWTSEPVGFEGCLRQQATPRQPSFMVGGVVPCVAGGQRGNLYAPNLLESWTEDRAGDSGYGHAATLYLNVSTWMPYQVILVALSVHLP